MKKWFVLLAALLIVVTVALYFLMPSKAEVAYTAVVPANANSIYRSLTNQAMIGKWMKQDAGQQAGASENSIKLGDHTFTFQPGSFNVVEVQVEGAMEEGSFITVLPVGDDSSLLRWKTDWPSAKNPYNRIRHSLQATRMKNDGVEVWRRLLDFLRKDENIYGLAIQETTVTDTLLLTSNQKSASYPTPPMYYKMIQEIRDFMRGKGLTETNYPMLHIQKQANQYEARVAVPVNKPIPASGNIELKKMVKGKLLTVEIRGGPATIDQSFLQMENYIFEKRLVSPAIPFQSLVTDRLLEPDTSKWITKLNYPVL